MNGYVTVTVDGKDYTVSISNGAGSLTEKGLAEGNYTADVVYAGDNTFSASNVTDQALVKVSRISVNSITITPRESSISVGENVVYSIVVDPSLNGYVTVTIADYDNDRIVSVSNVSISNGVGSLTV